MNLLRKLFGGGKPEAGATPAAASPLAESAAAHAVSLQHLWSEEPNALKFQIGRTLVPAGEKRSYAGSEQAGESPLAQAIFSAGGIEAVELESVYITVRMADDADWSGLQDRLPNMIRKFFAAGGEPLKGMSDGNGDARRYKFGFKQVQSRPREEQIRLVQDLFENEVNPAVAAHGGYFTLLDVQDNNVYVELGGGCQGCGMANVTLRQGVEARLREVLPEMVALIDQTDHASGQNPYYQPSKK